MFKVNLVDKEIGVEEGTKVIDLIRKEAQDDETIDIYKIIGCKVNNEIRNLNHEITDDSTITYVYSDSSDGMRIYIRGLSLILLKAFEDLYPNAKVTINYALGEALCCEVSGIEIIDEMVVSIRQRMQEIIEEDIPFDTRHIEKSKVKKMYIEDGHLERLDLLSKNTSYYAVLCFLEDTYGYFYGKMPISTKYIKLFDLKKYEKGVILMYPNRHEMTSIRASHMNKKLYGTLNEYESFYSTVGIRNINELNTAIKDGRIGEVIRVSEAMHEKKIATIADMIASDKQKKIILIAGPSSSGKTTFAQRLGIQLKVNRIKPVMMSVDNYFVEREDTPKDSNGEYDFECIEAIDRDLLNDHIERLLRGEEVEVPEFNFKTGQKEYKGNKIQLGDDGVLIMEGIHCLNDELTSKIPMNNKFRIFIAALTVLNIDSYNRISTTDTRLIRRIIRDSQFRNYSITDTISRWESVRRGEDKYIYPYQENADIMFNSALPYEFATFRTFIDPLLLTVNDDSPYYTEALRLYNLISLFLPLETSDIPMNSILREFIGRGCFYR